VAAVLEWCILIIHAFFKIDELKDYVKLSGGGVGMVHLD
jgi:hypothetical protein